MTLYESEYLIPLNVSINKIRNLNRFNTLLITLITYQKKTLNQIGLVPFLSKTELSWKQWIKKESIRDGIF